jgi:hypothetical protein
MRKKPKAQIHYWSDDPDGSVPCGNSLLLDTSTRAAEFVTCPRCRAYLDLRAKVTGVPVPTPTAPAPPPTRTFGAIVWLRCTHCNYSRGFPFDKLDVVAPAKGGLRSLKCEKCGAEMRTH